MSNIFTKSSIFLLVTCINYFINPHLNAEPTANESFIETIINTEINPDMIVKFNKYSNEENENFQFKKIVSPLSIYYENMPGDYVLASDIEPHSIELARKLIYNLLSKINKENDTYTMPQCHPEHMEIIKVIDKNPMLTSKIIQAEKDKSYFPCSLSQRLSEALHDHEKYIDDKFIENGVYVGALVIAEQAYRDNCSTILFDTKIPWTIEIIDRLIFIEANNRNYYNYQCTGFLFQDNIVLTARHCFESGPCKDQNDESRQCIALFANNPSNKLFFKIKSIPPQSKDNRLNDYVALDLEINKENWVKKFKMDRPNRSRKAVIPILFDTIEAHQKSKSPIHLIKWDSSPTCFTGGVNQCLFHGCQTRQGVSGAPIFEIDLENKEPIFIGIHLGQQRSPKSAPCGYSCATSYPNRGVSLPLSLITPQ